MDSIEKPVAKPSYEELEKMLVQALERIKQLEAIIAGIQKKADLNSQNSSKPPSSDPPWKPRSERKKSKRSIGGQKGHSGQTLKWQNKPDQVLIHRPIGTCTCGRCIGQASISRVVKRQILDLPELRIFITEHHFETRVCSCGIKHSSPIPKEFNVLVQYGFRVKSLAIYLMNTQFLSLKRCELFFTEVIKTSISQGSLVNWQALGFKLLEEVEQQIASAIRVSNVVHADETGIHVNGKLQWWHSASTPLLTHYHLSTKRGFDGMMGGGILQSLTGFLVHDCFAAYFKFKAIHALCNAHLMRELTRVFEMTSQEWACTLKVLLISMKQAVETQELSAEQRFDFEVCFQDLVQQGLALNPERLRIETTVGKRGRVGQGFTRSLLMRLRTHQSSWLRFLSDPRVPFDNNLAERDVRMVKVKEKVSGGSRGNGAVWFARIRGYVSTLRKQGQDVFHAFEQLFIGNVMLPTSLALPNTS